MTKKKEEVIPVNSELQKNLDIILSVKSEVDKLGNSALQIKVMDEATLSVAQQNLSSINQIVKSIEEKRKKIKEPYLSAGKLIDKTCNDIVELAEKGIEHIKAEIKAWEIKRQEEARKAQEEVQKKLEEERLAIEAQIKLKDEQRDFYQKVIDSLNQMYSIANTADKCDDTIQYIKDKFPPAEKFGDLGAQAIEQAQNVIQLLETKKQQFLSANTLSDVEKELIKAKEELMIEKNKIAQKEAELLAKEEQAKKDAQMKKLQEEADKERLRLEQEEEMNKTRGVREVWKFELVDKSKLTLDWCALDESKVKEYLKEKKDDLKDGEIVNGVKFYKDQSVRA